MKTFLSAALVAIALLGLSTGCHTTGSDCQELVCPQGDVAATPVLGQTWHTSPYCFGQPVEQVGQFRTYVINSVAELQAVSRCPDTLRIDFSKYTLLAGKTKTVSCSYADAQRVEATCEGLVYHVTVKYAACQAISEVLYTTLVPKLAAGTNVRFDVQVVK